MKQCFTCTHSSVCKYKDKSSDSLKLSLSNRTVWNGNLENTFSFYPNPNYCEFYFPKSMVFGTGTLCT